MVKRTTIAGGFEVPEDLKEECEKEVERWDLSSILFTIFLAPALLILWLIIMRYLIDALYRIVVTPLGGLVW